ncbi:MAG: FimV/HubP family polar landmark protein, partial [Cognaticolwellia aestuarii]
MQQFLRLCLWQVLIISISCFSMPISAEDGGIRIRGPKSTDAFPYDRYGPITGNDTLWNIALKVRPDPRLSVYQVMQALFENNPDAFKDSNLNHMINGQYLKIPSIEAMRAISTENAQKKSRSDDKAWQKKVVKVVSKKAKTPEEASVNKKDLEAAKSEINVQLKAIDTTQQQRLATIQNDVLDSIDGLQSLLKENEALRKRLGSFNEQLDVMQNEVAKSKEIKLQMDNMIALQQALLAKAEAREQALLLEQQKAELEGNSIMSSSWFIALMATLPAILVLALIAILLRRRSNKENDAKPASTKKEKLTEQEPEASVAAAEEPKTVDNELSLEDDVSLDSELSLDDELSIDLSEVDDDQDDLFSDDLSSLDDELLDDDVIQLDDDLADLDDLEDISLDDDLETLALDEDIVESDALEGGQLDQSDLDSLFAGLEDEPNDSDDTIDILDSDLVEQGDLDSLLSESSDDDLVVSEDEELMNKPEDIDALLDASLEENTDVSDPDDIDALLDASVEENTDVSDPDDIDALLDA